MDKPTSVHFRRAVAQDQAAIWAILSQAIERRRQDGSRQWQDGYPNPETVDADIEAGQGFVLENASGIVAYAAVIFNDEPSYDNIEGKWLTDGPFVVVHRVAVSDAAIGKGYAAEIFRQIENFAVQNEIYSVKVDTNYDNLPMLHIFEKLGYQYCGEVYFRGSARKAFEKVLK